MVSVFPRVGETSLCFSVGGRYPESEYSSIKVFEYSRERKEKGKNTLKACVSLSLDILQSDSMASRKAVILID